MSGIFLLLLILIWLIIVLFITIWFVKRINALPWKWLVGVMLLMVLIPLPLIDEIVGGWQFKQLCKENAGIKVDREKARGKNIYLLLEPPEEVKGTWLPMQVRRMRYVDEKTDEVIFSYNSVYAQRSWLTFGTGALFTFSGHCEPNQFYLAEDVLQELKMKKVNQPIQSNGEIK